METNTKEIPKKKDNKRLIIFAVIIISSIVIYFWRQDVEYKKCYEVALKHPNGGVNPLLSSDRCKIILSK